MKRIYIHIYEKETGESIDAPFGDFKSAREWLNAQEEEKEKIDVIKIDEHDE